MQKYSTATICIPVEEFDVRVYADTSTHTKRTIKEARMRKERRIGTKLI